MIDLRNEFKEKADKAFRESLRWQTYCNLFSNSFIDRVTAKSLYDLTMYPKN